MLTPDQIWLVRQQYKLGKKTPADLAKEFNCTAKEVCWALYMDAKRIQMWMDVRREYREGTISIFDLSKKYGIATSEAWRIATNGGLDKRRP